MGFLYGILFFLYIFFTFCVLAIISGQSVNDSDPLWLKIILLTPLNIPIGIGVFLYIALPYRWFKKNHIQIPIKRTYSENDPYGEENWDD